MGASSSKRFGCWRKISLEAAQSCRISDSDSCTCLALTGLGFRKSNNLFMMSSNNAESMDFSLSHSLVSISALLFLYSTPNKKTNKKITKIWRDNQAQNQKSKFQVPRRRVSISGVQIAQGSRLDLARWVFLGGRFSSEISMAFLGWICGSMIEK